MDSLSDKLKPCPFCGRKMAFWRETYTNKLGKTVCYQYYMHREDDAESSESCILDEICMPFTIGAGDADPKTGYIGEYAEKWNERVYNDKETNAQNKSK